MEFRWFLKMATRENDTLNALPRCGHQLIINFSFKFLCGVDCEQPKGKWNIFRPLFMENILQKKKVKYTTCMMNKTHRNKNVTKPNRLKQKRRKKSRRKKNHEAPFPDDWPWICPLFYFSQVVCFYCHCGFVSSEFKALS